MKGYNRIYVRQIKKDSVDRELITTRRVLIVLGIVMVVVMAKSLIA